MAQRKATTRKPRKTSKANKRKTRAGGINVPPPLVTILVLAAVLCFFYLYIHSRNEALGIRIQEMEQELKQVRNRVLTEESKWANTISLPNVRRALERFNIKMDWPGESRVIRGRMPVDDLLETADAIYPYRQYAGLPGAGGNE